MRKYLSILFFIVITSTILFESCFKKGDEDPFLSLKSRESRIKGKWEVTKYTKAGTDMLNKEDKNSGYYYYPCGSYNYIVKTEMALIYDFDKDGEAIITTDINNTTIYDYSNNYCTDKTQTCSGSGTNNFWKWAFLTKNNGKKNKEQIVLSNQFEAGIYIYCNSYSNTYYNSSIFPFVYDIIKLSNKEMTWETTIENEFIEMEFRKQ